MKTGLYFFAGAAGLTSALCYLAVGIGSPALFLFGYIAPLPLLIAGLGWGVAASATAIAAAALTCVLAASLGTALIYLVTVGAPSAWLAHLVVLGRPAGEATGSTGVQRDGTMEWYPLGRVLVWAGVFGGSALALTFARVNFDLEAYKAPIERLLTGLWQHSRAGLELRERYGAELTEGLALALPLAAALLWTMTMVVNLWLAAKIVARSGQLPRPWPDLAAIELPRTFLAAYFVIFIIAIAAGGATGYVAAFYASALSFLWIVIGLAVLHTLTRGRGFRGPLLSITYISLLIFGWPAVLLMFAGISEQVFNLRRRFRRSEHLSPDA